MEKEPQKTIEQGGGKMGREPVVVQESAREWETWPDEEVAKKGLVYWKPSSAGMSPVARCSP